MGRDCRSQAARDHVHRDLALVLCGCRKSWQHSCGSSWRFPNGNFLPPEVFNRLFTVHGTTMVFLVGMPFFAGLANYLVPLMIGARDMAFPRLNAFGYWMFLFGGMLLYFSYIGGEGLAGHGTAPDVGWFAYAPLTERAFSRGTSTDYWILSIIVSGIGTTASAINVIATIVSHALQRHDARAHAPVRVADAGGLGNGADGDAAVDGRPDHAAAGPVSWALISSTRRQAGRHCCGSIFSGCLGTPRSTS